MAGSTGREPSHSDDTTTTLASRTSAPPPKRPSMPSRAPAPTHIGRYEVERLLGQGGMGRVWLARDTVLGRKVAIKVLRDDLKLPPAVHDELVVRMGHEAQAAAAVSHPNIVVLHDMGEDPVLGLFLVFEYVTTRSEEAPGEDVVLSLRDRLKRGPLPLPEIAKLAREVGSALSFAHEAGVIHRDVKPENILFSRTGFKIADFGIARIPDSTITQTNTVLGTPAYTAPEALSNGVFSAATDQFALAATLYEAATGFRAFSGEDAIATAGKVSSEPPPPMQDTMGPMSVVRSLDEVLQRAMSKTPEARYASCAELGDAVARAVERATTTTPPPLMPPPILSPSLLELERTPLSSRARMAPPSVLAAIAASGETPRPSLFIRQRTHRFQNIAAGVAILVIAALIVIGRKSPSGDGAPSTASARPSASVAPATPKRGRHVAPQPTIADSADAAATSESSE